MSGLANFFTDPWDPEFMRRAFVVAVLSGIACGIVGCYVVLRGMAFIGDAVSHAVFPGVATAFALQANMVLGGAIGGMLTAAGIALFSQNRRLREDTVIGVFYSATFGLGIVILSTAPGYSGSLESFLFGQILGLGDDDVLTALIATPLLLVVLSLLHKELVAVSLDRETAQVSGLPVLVLDLALYAMVTAAIVISLQAIGNILALALLIVPAASARLLTDRLLTMMLVAPLFGGLSAVVGLYISYHRNLAAGGTIVMVATAGFIACWMFAPRHGLVASLRARGLGGAGDARGSGDGGPDEGDAGVVEPVDEAGGVTLGRGA